MFLRRVKLRGFLFAATMLGGLVYPHASFAQVVNLPGSADPGRAIQDFELQARPDTSLQKVEDRRKAVAEAPDGTESLTFVLQDLQVDGMTAYDVSDVEPIYSDYLGKKISVATLFEIIAELQQKYLDDGYALTKVVIPNQNIEGGHVRLSVIEGHIQTVELGEGLDQSPQVRDAARSIVGMHPLNVRKLERIMLLLNDLPDLNISAIIAGDHNSALAEDGAVRLVLQKNEEVLNRGSIRIDNHGSVFTGPLQIQANAQTYSFAVPHSELGVSGMVAVPFKEQRLGSVYYTMPVFGASGTKVTLSVSKALTEPGSSLSTLDIKGASENMEAEVSYPVIRQRDMTLGVDAGFEFKNSRTKILGEELYDDRLRIAKAGVDLNFTDSWAGYNVAHVKYAQGLGLFGVREAGSEYLSREDGEPEFKKFEFLAGRLQALPRDFEILALVTGQYSFDPLLSSEEFGFGGGQMGRGYDSSEITGDRGIAGTIELRYKAQTQFGGAPVALQPYVFYDIGKVWNIDSNAKDKISAASAGAGVRLNISNSWDIDFNLSRPMTKSAENEPKYQNDTGSRAIISISRSF